jgi:dipeptidase E
VKLLLTSGGITNASIRDALVELLGKPIEGSSALVVPTAIHPMPIGPNMAWQVITGSSGAPLTEIGWKSLGVLELTALPTVPQEHWVSAVRETDALLVSGGDPLYLAYWMKESGLADLLPSLDAVYVGLSAGSMVMTPRTGERFVTWRPPIGGDETLGLVDFGMFPHVDHPSLPRNTIAAAEEWAAGMSFPCYAVDDATAFKVVDGDVEVVSEGTWRLLEA